MSVLPLNWPDKVDSPELVAWLQQYGLEKYIDSNQINSIRDALNELYFSSNPDRIISLGTETIDENEYTYEDYTWQLGGVQVNNIGNPSVIVIPSATVGFKRKDISVFTPAGTIERVAGTETDGEVVTSPDVPEGTLYYKSYDIDGDTIGVDPEPPAIDGSIYKKKIENTRYKSRLSGENIIIPFQAAGQSHYSVTHAALVSVAGFTTAGLTTPMYEGQDVIFENQTGHDITLKDSFGVDTSFVIGADLIVPNNGKIWFRFRNNELELIMKSWSEVDLSTKADLVNGIVPLEQLPDFSPTKKTQKIYFSNSGFTYNNSIGGWLQPGGGNRFNQSYSISSPPLNINNNFEGFNYLGGIHEIIDFDSKIKKIELQFAKTSVASVGFDFRIVLLNYKLPLSDFPMINQNLPYDKLIVFDKTYRMANPLYYNVEINANELLDNTLLKGSYLRMFIGLFSYTSNQASVINFSMTNQLEEV